MRTKRILAFTFSALRAMLMLALIAYTVVEYVEFNSQKEVLHLTLFSMFFLVSNFLVNIGRHKAVLGEDEKAQSLFFLAMFAMAAAMFELVDLGLDQVLKVINATSMQILHICYICTIYNPLGHQVAPNRAQRSPTSPKSIPE